MPGSRPPCQQRLDSLHRRRVPMMASNPYSRPWLRPQRADLAAQPAGFERLLDEQRDLVEIERLVDVVVRAPLHRLDRVFDGREAGHQDDEGVGDCSLIRCNTVNPSPSGSLKSSRTRSTPLPAD